MVYYLIYDANNYEYAIINDYNELSDWESDLISLLSIIDKPISCGSFAKWEDSHTPLSKNYLKEKFLKKGYQIILEVPHLPTLSHITTYYPELLL